MPREPLPIEQTLSMLRSAPARIQEMTAGLSPAQLRARPGPDDWSVVEVLAHLRSCADVWGGCIATILAEDHPTIRAIDPRTWMRDTDYPDLEFQPSFDAFTAQRMDLIATLEQLSNDEWPRKATMTGAGKPIERSLQSFAERLAIHERPHLKQINRTANAFREQVSSPPVAGAAELLKRVDHHHE